MKIAYVVQQVVAEPAPVLMADTCCLLDCLRCWETPQLPHLQSARRLSEHLQFVRRGTASRAVHFIVAELVPGEFQDNVDIVQRERLEQRFNRLTTEYAHATALLAYLQLQLLPVMPNQRQQLLDAIADVPRRLLAEATVLDREQVCIDRALTRLIQKRRPSHNKEIKDSIMLEQYLELTRQLRAANVANECVFASSNTNDFAERGKIHPDLDAELRACQLDYLPSLAAAVGKLKI